MEVKCMTRAAADASDRVGAILAEKLAESATRPLPSLTERSIRQPWGLEGKATAVIGMRRAGKTCFLHQLRQQRLQRGTPRAHLPYIDFEDDRLAGLEVRHLSGLVEAFYRTAPELRGGTTPVLWCLDEVQVVPGWERLVRRLLDTECVEVAVSGSSAALLSREIATELRGRSWPVVVYPFSFGEALRHAGHVGFGGAKGLTGRARSAQEKALAAYLEVGGFPEAQGLAREVRHRLLRDYVDVAVLRDVVERHGVTNVTALQWLIRHLLGNAAGRFSVEKFHAWLRSQGVAASRDTLHELLACLEDCFLVRTVWMEAASARQRMVNPRKVYPVDPGLIPLFDRTGRANLGHALETVVLLELERRGAEVTYVKTPGGHEVDFLARYPDGRVELVQVCADASEPAVAARELRALAEARSILGKARALLLTATQAGLPAVLPPRVTAMPASLWLLAAPGSAPEPMPRKM
jgi:predicted AAA+ superfamily ATPase